MRRRHEVGVVLHAFGLYPFTVEGVEDSREVPGTLVYRTRLGGSGSLVHETHVTTYRIPHAAAERVLEWLRGHPAAEMPETYEEAVDVFGLDD